jgi:hypothetical protein
VSRGCSSAGNVSLSAGHCHCICRFPSSSAVPVDRSVDLLISSWQERVPCPLTKRVLWQFSVFLQRIHLTSNLPSAGTQWMLTQKSCWRRLTALLRLRCVESKFVRFLARLLWVMPPPALGYIGMRPPTLAGVCQFPHSLRLCSLWQNRPPSKQST